MHPQIDVSTLVGMCLGGTEIQSAHDVADGDEGMLELMASVSLGRVGSPHHRGSAGATTRYK